MIFEFTRGKEGRLARGALGVSAFILAPDLQSYLNCSDFRLKWVGVSTIIKMPPLVHDMMSEQWGKQAQDSLHLLQQQRNQQHHHYQHQLNSCNNNIDLPPVPIQSTFFPGALIVGGGPSGLATAACLTNLGVPSLVLEKSSCLASLWQQKAYDRLHLHLPKQFCELPLLPFPDHLPAYPTRHQFVEYLQTYASHFKVRPLFHHQVDSATFNPTTSLWHVRVRSVISNKIELLGGEHFAAGSVQEYSVRWLVVASGENAEPVIPSFKNMQEFQGGKVFHSSQYRNGVEFAGKKVLVVGCGNSGMEIALDLANFGASPSLVVRSPVSMHAHNQSSPCLTAQLCSSSLQDVRKKKNLLMYKSHPMASEAQ